MREREKRNVDIYTKKKMTDQHKDDRFKTQERFKKKNRDEGGGQMKYGAKSPMQKNQSPRFKKIMTPTKKVIFRCSFSIF